MDNKETLLQATPLRALALGRMLGWYAEGVKEDPPGSNWGPTVRDILARAGIHVPAPWCAAAVYAAVDDVTRWHGLPNPLASIVRKALVADYYQVAQERGWIIEPHLVDRGDLVIFDFPDNDKRWDHMGLVVDPPGEGMSFRSIEGNTGDRLMIRERFIVPGRVVFARWDEGITIPFQGKGD